MRDLSYNLNQFLDSAAFYICLALVAAIGITLITLLIMNRKKQK